MADIDWDAVYQALWREVLAVEGQLSEDAAAFASEFAGKLRAQGWALDADAEKQLTTYIDAAAGSIRGSIAKAVTPVADVAVGKAMRSEFVARMTQEAYAHRWPDGLTLSERVWDWKKKTSQGVTDVLSQGIRAGKSATSLVYDMQRSIERTMGSRFAMAARPADIEGWESTLSLIARTVAPLHHDPEIAAKWRKTMDQARQQIAGLSDRGLKRIARTEMACAHHRAVIDGTQDAEYVIGYHWRLSASHPEADICDYYADVDFGLGAGVWPKDRVPQEKAHPRCMCPLVPLVTPREQRGSTSYGDFLDKLSDGKKAELLPRWANEMSSLGVPMSALVTDGKLMTREALRAQLGDEKFGALTALSKARQEGAPWKTLKLRVNNSMTAQTLDALRQHREVPEVADFLDRVEGGGRRVAVDGREWHYLKRRYQNGEALDGPEALDLGYTQTLSTMDSSVWHTAGGRYAVYSPHTKWTAYAEANGERVTAFPQTLDEMVILHGEVQWTLGDLLQIPPPP